MDVPITQFRREIFALMDRALEGETIKVSCKGRSLLISPEINPTKRLDKLTKLDFIAPGQSALMDDAQMKAEMLAGWEADWAEI
jgi:hypothetical protein